MAKLIRLAEHRTKPAFVHFNRTELTLLLNLYARRVAGGEWRDYAIDQGPERAVFAIYRHTLEQPLFTITKLGPEAAARSRGGDFIVAAGDRQLARSGSLSEALRAFDHKPRRVV
ncbi:MAG: DUF2794 domain-containing protein [Solirubrobacterales bacterium]